MWLKFQSWVEKKNPLPPTTSNVLEFPLMLLPLHIPRGGALAPRPQPPPISAHFSGPHLPARRLATSCSSGLHSSFCTTPTSSLKVSPRRPTSTYTGGSLRNS